MKAFATLLGTIVVFFLAHALPAGAAITVIRDYHMGEADPGVTVGLPATVCVDSVSNNNLTMTGAPVYSADTVTPSISSLSLQFNGTNYGVANLVSNLTDNFGVEAWVKTTANSGIHYLFYNGSASANGNGWGIFQNGSYYEAQFGQGGGLVDTFGFVPAPMNAWTHVALVANNGTTTLYINGLPAGSSGTSYLSPDHAFAIATAPDNPGTNTWIGSMDEVRVFKFAPGAFQRSDLLLNRPVLNASQQGGQMLVTWPTNFGYQYILETSSNMFNWTPLSPYQVNDLLITSNSVANGSRFYRLNDTQPCFNTNVPIQLALHIWQDSGMGPDPNGVNKTYTSYYVGVGQDDFLLSPAIQSIDNSFYRTHIDVSVIGGATNCFSEYTYSWQIDFGIGDYAPQGITGYFTPQLTILESTLPSGYETDFYLTVTRVADGRQDTFYFPTMPNSSLVDAMTCQQCIQCFSCGCPVSYDGPTSEPHQ